MSGDLTARDVIARKLACQYNGEPGDDSGWEYHVDHALELMDTLAAAGWELHRKPVPRWGYRLNDYPDHVYERGDEESARRGADVNPEGRTVVYWPHGGKGWELAPDA